MLDWICRKSCSGDVDVNLAKRHLAAHEWGQARIALERALAKGQLSEPQRARILLQDVCERMAVKNRVDF